MSKDEGSSRKGPKFDRFGLEMDVMKKITHQLERLPDQEAKARAADYVLRAVRESRPAAPDAAPAVPSATPAFALVAT